MKNTIEEAATQFAKICIEHQLSFDEINEYLQKAYQKAKTEPIVPDDYREKATQFVNFYVKNFYSRPEYQLYRREISIEICIEILCYFRATGISNSDKMLEMLCQKKLLKHHRWYNAVYAMKSLVIAQDAMHNGKMEYDGEDPSYPINWYKIKLLLPKLVKDSESFKIVQK